MIRKTEKDILTGMQTGLVHMALYDDLYKSFRTIRHDFANYIQSSQFESEDESFILRLRMLKKNTLQDVNSLLQRIAELPFDVETPNPEMLYPELAKKEPPKRMKEKERVLFGLWEALKPYFISQQHELLQMREVLLHLQDRLERSLPPDEVESLVHLRECDSIQCHMTADTVLLSAYTYTMRKELGDYGAEFRFRLLIPPAFTEAEEDLYYLLGAARERVLSCMERMKEYPALPKALVRISLAAGLGLWHFSLEYGLFPDDEANKDVPKEDIRGFLFREEKEGETLPLSAKDKALKRILKRHKALLSLSSEDGMLQIDVVG